MKIEIYSDIVCPYCWIGKRQLELALERYGSDDVEVIYRSFELDPHMDNKEKIDVYEMLTKKYGMTREQAKENTSRLSQRASSIGLEFNMDKALAANSFNAHRLVHFAKAKNKQAQAMDRLHKAYFGEGKDIEDVEQLVELAKELQLDEVEVRKMLDSDEFTDDVRNDQKSAREIGVTGVPFFIFDEKYSVSGAQGEETFLEILKQIS